MTQPVLRCALVAALSLLSLYGCDGDDDTHDKLITLSAAIPDPVPLEIGVTTGTLVLDLSASPLDVSQGDDLMAVLISGGIGLTVTNTDTGLGYNLTDGDAMEDTPSSAGQYGVFASEDGETLTIVFFNSFDGNAISGDSSYSALVEVLENGYFTVETFTRGVTVTQ